MVALALFVGGCGSDERRICQRSGAAEVCLVGGPSSYDVEAEGFEPNSEATITTGAGGEPLVVPVDTSGRVARDSGKVSVLGGTDAQEVVAVGRTSEGRPVELKLTVPAR